MAGYCFRCDAPADGDACPRCGSPLYREQKRIPAERRHPPTVGEDPRDRPGGPRFRIIVAILTIALLLVTIAIVAASSSGIS